MNITSISQAQYKTAYGILCDSLPKTGLSDALSPSFCFIEVGGQTTRHKHFEPEIFFIIQGQGEMTIGENSTSVRAGDLIQIPPFSLHTLKNTGDSPLQFLSIYTEDFTVPKLPSDVLITAAPPTPNGPLHLGHISGPYLAADILARYLLSKNVYVLTHTGTDDHQNYVGEKARSLQLGTNEFRSHRRVRIQRGFSNMDIHFDEFIEPSQNSEYQNKIKHFFKKAVSMGVIKLETIAFPYCADCDLTLVDVHADGTCPHCHSPSRGGCESCGIVVPAHKLTHVHCGRCGQPAQSEMKSVYTFDLKAHLPLIANDLDQLNLSARLQQLVDEVQMQTENKVLVAYPTTNDLGIQVDGFNIHVWLEMAAHYEQFALGNKFWAHSFGFDNSFYYLLFIPALLKALNPNARLPNTVITNEFLLLDGAKFSTSRGHAIWADEFSGDSEHLRLYLSQIRPSQQTSNFELEKFNSFSKELQTSLTQVFNRAAEIVNSRKISNPNFIGSEEADSSVIVQSQRFLKDFEMLMAPGNFDPRPASRLISNFIDTTVQSLGNLANDKVRIQSLGTALIAFMPGTANRILSILSLDVHKESHAEAL